MPTPEDVKEYGRQAKRMKDAVAKETRHNLDLLLDRYESGDISPDMISECGIIATIFCQAYQVPPFELADLLVRLVNSVMEQPLDFTGE